MLRGVRRWPAFARNQAKIGGRLAPLSKLSEIETLIFVDGTFFFPPRLRNWNASDRRGAGLWRVKMQLHQICGKGCEGFGNWRSEQTVRRGSREEADLNRRGKEQELALLNRDCPKCGFDQPRRMARESWFSRNVMHRFGCYPWECPMCRLVFYRKSRLEREPRLPSRPVDISSEKAS